MGPARERFAMSAIPRIARLHKQSRELRRTGRERSAAVGSRQAARTRSSSAGVQPHWFGKGVDPQALTGLHKLLEGLDVTLPITWSIPRPSTDETDRSDRLSTAH